MPIVTFRSELLANAAYLASGVLFILALRGLSSQETARRGNMYGVVGMVIAIGATFTHPLGQFNPLLYAAIGVAAVIGALLAMRVGMTQMPELVALLHSFVGLAAVLVGFSLQLHGVAERAEGIEIFIDVIIGAITDDPDPCSRSSSCAARCTASRCCCPRATS